MWTACTIAALLSATLVSGGQTGHVASPITVARPSFALGAGDALGVQIRARDEILARRLESNRAEHAAVPTPD